MPARAPYPAVLDLAGAKALILGGGRVALQKLRGLPRGLARVTVVAPQASPAVQAWIARRPGAVLRLRRLRAADLAGCRLCFCCADDPAANAQAAAWARRRGAWVCQAAQPAQGDLSVPAVIRAAGVTLTLSTGGASPALAKRLRQRLQAQLQASDLAWLLAQLARRRAALKADPARKRELLARAASQDALTLALAPRSAAGRRRLQALFKSRP